MVKKTNWLFPQGDETYYVYQVETLEEVKCIGNLGVCWLASTGRMYLRGEDIGYFDGEFFTFRMEEIKEQAKEFREMLDQGKNWDKLFAELLEQSSLPEEVDFYGETREER